MVGRHPHVFGDAAAREAMNIRSADDVVAVWDELKAHDKPHRSSVLDGIPQGMPALALADKLAGRAEKVGVAIAVPDAVAASATEAELGAHLLAIASTARAAGLDPERALRTALRGLQEEIRAMEAAAARTE